MIISSVVRREILFFLLFILVVVILIPDEMTRRENSRKRYWQRQRTANQPLILLDALPCIDVFPRSLLFPFLLLFLAFCHFLDGVMTPADAISAVCLAGLPLLFLFFCFAWRCVRVLMAAADRSLPPSLLAPQQQQQQPFRGSPVSKKYKGLQRARGATF